VDDHAIQPVSFDQARETTRRWLSKTCPDAVVLGIGSEDEDFWRVEWECDPRREPDGLPIPLVDKRTGAVVEVCPAADMSVFNRLDAMTPVSGTVR